MLKSAARVTVEPTASMSRVGLFGTERYAMIEKMSNPVIVPPVRPRFGTAVPFAHEPAAGLHTPEFGRTVVSFAVPAHRRGPFSADRDGLALASPRPHDCSRHVPADASATDADIAKFVSPPNGTAFA